MNQQNSRDRKFLQMTRTPIRGLTLRLAAPSVIGTLSVAAYGIADAFFVSCLGTSASGAVGVVSSVTALIQAVGYTLGQGASNTAARLLGEQNSGEAKRTLTTGFAASLLAGAALAAIGWFWSEPLVLLLGATGTIAPYAAAYVRIVLLSAPCMTASFAMGCFLRGQGNTFHAMIGVTAGAAVSAALNPLFIFTFGLGTTGAALALAMGQFVEFMLYAAFINSRISTIKLSPKYFSFSPRVIKNIFVTGMPSFYRQGAASLSAVVMNRSLRPYGDARIAAMSIVSRIYLLISSGVTGFGLGMQPACAYNFGAGKFDRITGAYRFCKRASAVYLTLVAAAAFVFAPRIMAAFRQEDQLINELSLAAERRGITMFCDFDFAPRGVESNREFIETGTLALRMICGAAPFLARPILCTGLCESTGRSALASALTVCHSGLFFIIAVTLLSRMFGLRGIQMSTPVGIILAFLMAVIVEKNGERRTGTAPVRR
ncbi:MAG: MATE family efflux transporter [Oscillospiraceae bacterium]|nr:MATE family efflux transporter [Oscillospiraceae bacterium]